MTSFNTTLSFAHQLDSQDPLASSRDGFIITDPDLIYLDGNSLGRMPKASAERAKQIVDQEWGYDLIRGWNKGWWDAPARVGDKIGQLIGAADGQVIVSDTTSINLFKLVMSALTYQPNKKRIITDTLNFPSDLYILQGCVNTLSSALSETEGTQHIIPKRSGVDATRNTQHEIIRITSNDNDLTPNLAQLESAINENTSLVTLSHEIGRAHV